MSKEEKKAKKLAQQEEKLQKKAEAKAKKAEKKAEKAENGKKGGFPFGALVLLAVSAYYIVTALMADNFNVTGYGIGDWFALAPAASLFLFALTLLGKKANFLQVLCGLIATAGQSVVVADYLQTNDQVGLIASIATVVAYALLTVVIIVRRKTKAKNKFFWILPVLAIIVGIAYPIAMNMPTTFTTEVIVELALQAATVIGFFAATLRVAK